MSEEFSKKRIVLCFDGTNNQFGVQNTNVVKFFAMLTKNSTSKQRVYYQTGIGTFDSDGPPTKLGLAIDSAVAYNIKDHVIGGYKFLMQTYESGDEISLFGFSRGAVIARTLAAMLYIVGLLPGDNEEHVPFAWSVFKKAHKETSRPKTDPKRYYSLNFKRTFSRDVTICMLGLWDTVIGVAPVRLLRHMNHNPIVSYVRHAMSLDETRDRFQLEQWIPKGDQDQELFRDGDHSDIPAAAPAVRVGGNTAVEAQLEVCGDAGYLSVKNGPERPDHTHVKEVWFAGYHSDVGGGNTSYEKDHALSNIPLRWMVREALANTHILFENSVLELFKVKLPGDMPESGDAVITKAKYCDWEKSDAYAGSHSPYKGGLLGRFYAFTEYLPKIRTDGRGFLPHLFKPRKLTNLGASQVRIHSSVLTILEQKGHDPKRRIVSRHPPSWGSENIIIEDAWALSESNEFANSWVNKFGGEK